MDNDEALPILADACGQGQAVSQLERIRQGELVWFRGCAAIAEEGTLAIDTGGGRIVVIDREDVRSAERADAIFMVGVTPGANILVRTESVLRAETDGCSCPEEEPPTPATGAIALRIGETFPDPFLPNHICRLDWTMVWVCRWVIDGCSRPRRFCYPTWRRVVTCRHEGLGTAA